MNFDKAETNTLKESELGRCTVDIMLLTIEVLPKESNILSYRLNAYRVRAHRNIFPCSLNAPAVLASMSGIGSDITLLVSTFPVK